MMACAVPATGEAFLSGLLAHIDCQAQVIGASGYQALASPTSPISLVLTALLTLFIAVFGIRMLLGHVPGFSDVIMATLKIGIVLVLATSWGAYRVVAYDTILKGPAELLDGIGSPSGLPGAEGGLAGRLQAVDNAIVAFTVAGSGRFDLAVVPTPETTAAASRAPVSDDVALGIARTTYLGATLGSLGLVRLIAGLMLALAPVFAGLLLFEATRSFFIGWARLLIGAALGALAVTMVLAIELAILEPWLTHVLALRTAHYATPSAPIELLVVTLAFAVVLFGVVALCVRLAFANALPGWLQGHNPILGRTALDRSTVPAMARSGVGDANMDVSRAFVVAEAIATAQRREEGMAGGGRIAMMGASISGAARDGRDVTVVPIGQSYGRTLRRVSASTARRSQRI